MSRFPENTKTLPERIRVLIEDKGLTVNRFETSIGVARGTIRKAIDNNRSLGSDKIEKIFRTFPVNLNWLVAGVGEMYSKDIPGETTLSIQKDIQEITNESIGILAEKVPFDEILNIYSKKGHTVPYYEVDASAGAVEMFNEENEVPALQIYIQGFEDCDLALNVWGDSMDPVYKTGEIAICKRVHDVSLILYGEAYLVVTSEFRTIKYLQPSERDSDIVLVSENEFYKPVTIRRDSILHLFRIKGKINRNAI